MTSEKSRDSLLIVILTLIVGPLVAVIYGVNSIPAGDALTYATLARSLAETGILAHSSALPSDIIELGGFPNLDISQNTGYSLLLAPFMLLFPVGNTSFIFVSVMLYSANSVLIYHFASQYFDKKVARLSAFLLIFSPAYFPYIYSGLAEPLIILCLIGSLCLYGSSSRWKALFMGGLVSIIYLTKSATFIFLLPFFCAMAGGLGKGKLRQILTFSTVICAVVVINIFRQMSTGEALVSEKSDLIDLVFYDLAAPGAWYEGLRALNLPLAWVDPTEHVLDNFGLYVERYARTFYEFYLKLFGLRLMFIGSIFAGIYLFTSLEDKSEWKFRFALLSIPSLLVLGFSIGWPIERYILPALPLFIIAMSAGIYRSIHNHYLRRVIIASLVIPWFGFVVQGFIEESKPDYSKVGEIVEELTNPNDTVVTNVPGLISWYGRRKSILYPTTFDEFLELKEKNSETRSLILTSDIYSLYRSTEGQLEWDNVFKQAPQYLDGGLCLQGDYQVTPGAYRVLVYKGCGLKER